MISIKEFEVLWNIMADKVRLNGNGYRILIDFALYGGHISQQQYLERRSWSQASVSNTFKRLYDENFLLCELEGRKVVYLLNTELFKNGICTKKDVVIDIETFVKVWDVIIEISALSANSYRVLIDILLYGATTQKGLWERRGWKIAGVSATFRKLHDMNFLILHEETGQKIYTANINYILSLKKEE